ncbi:MAG: tetratricopeptide repeat protein [Pirellulales bacterium]|nr:tetratricopeptide repeat protein [Pirellulales bacterium]
MQAAKNTLVRKNAVTSAILFIGLGCASSMLRGDDAADAFERGARALTRKRFDRAIIDFTEAVKLQPKEAKYQGMLSVALLDNGDYEKGAAALKSAVELHPGDVGGDYKPTTDKPLPPAALEHGRQQVRKMLADRPAMAEYAAESGFLRDWAARKFAGEDLGSLIDWDPEPPTDSDAEHTAPGETEHGSIQVHPEYTHGRRVGRPRNFEELWAGAVYELHNINNARHFVKLHERAAAGKVSKEAFVGGIVKHEVVAAQQTRAFYLKVFLPFAAKQQLSTQPTLWFAQWWDQPDEALKGFTDKSAYPWQPYARQYDWLTVEHLFDISEFDKAARLLAAMCGETDGQYDHADVHLWLGRCHLKLNRPKEAVEEFGTALKMLPDYAEIYQYRAQAYERLGEKEKAAADEKKFKELNRGA